MLTKKRFTVALTLLICLSTTPAIAETGQPGFSVTALVGAGMMQDSIAGFPNQDRIPYTFRFDTGIAAGLAVGYRLSPHWRVGLELARRDNDLSGTSTPGSAGGHLAVTALMADIYFELLPQARVTPYVGVGGGYAWTDFDGISINGSRFLDDTAHAPAFQGIVGALYRIAPEWSLSADYRYLATLDPKVVNTAGEIMEPGIRNHAFTIGITRYFGR